MEVLAVSDEHADQALSIEGPADPTLQQPRCSRQRPLWQLLRIIGSVAAMIFLVFAITWYIDESRRSNTTDSGGNPPPMALEGTDDDGNPAPNALAEFCNGGNPWPKALSTLPAKLGVERVNRITSAVANLRQPGMIVLATRHVLCMLDSFMASTRIMVTAKFANLSIVVTALDRESSEFCSQLPALHAPLSITCVDLTGWLPDILLSAGNQGIHGDNAGFGTCTYAFIVETKATIMLHAANASDSSGIMMIDIDIVLVDNLFDWIHVHRRPGATILTARESVDDSGDGINTGTIFANASAVPLLLEWVNRNPSCPVGPTKEQACIAVVLRAHSAIDTGIHQFIPNRVIGQCANEGTYATHYNCIDSKVGVMKQRGVWRPTSPVCRDAAYSLYV